MKHKLVLILIMLLSGIQYIWSNPLIHNIESFGAMGDGVTMNTAAIQKAIDTCSEQGGEVYIPKGCFLFSTILLRDHVTIRLDAQAILRGSPNPNDYPADPVTKKRALIYASKVTNIAIVGRGTIDGNGNHRNFWHKDMKNGIQGGIRPFVFSLNESTDIKFKEFTVKNGAFWNIAMELCEHITIDDIKILSRVVANNDGIDLADCANVRISNSYLDVGDDGICLKSHSPKGVKHIAVTNCIIKSESNCIKFGTASIGGFEDIVVSNCTFFDTRLSGIAIELVDGGVIDRITFNNITMHNVNGSIFVKLGARNHAVTHTMTDGIIAKQTGILRNISFSDIIADGIGCWKEDTSAAFYKEAHDSRIGMNIIGQPNFPVENIAFNNISLQFAGGGTIEDSKKELTDNHPKGYPEYTNTGITPAYGINCLHTRNISLNNIKLSFMKVDHRPAICFQDVEGSQINNLQAQLSDKASCFIRMSNVKDIFISNCNPHKIDVPYLIMKEEVKDINLTGNNFKRVKTIYQLADSENEKEINTAGNIKKNISKNY